MKVIKIFFLTVTVLWLMIIILPLINAPDNVDYNEAVRQAPGKFITVNGKKVHYIEKGAGMTVICIHGFLYNTVMWEKNIDALAEKYRVLAIDLWGWGYSERLKNSRYSFKTYGDQVIGFMDAMKIKKASLIGQSMGGGTSVYTAAHYPDRIDRLILVDPAVLPYERGFIASVYAMPYIGEFFNAIPGDSMIENNIKTIWFYDKNAVTDKYLKKVVTPLRIKDTFKGAMHILRIVLRPPMVEKEAQMLARLNKQILIVHGRDDNDVPLERSETLNRLWKGSRLEIFEKARHSPHEEYPDKFNRLALEFLE